MHVQIAPSWSGNAVRLGTQIGTYFGSQIPTNSEQALKNVGGHGVRGKRGLRGRLYS